uniref:Uncharacterized protein n=1 Tax=Avena sativa TaxID=4498 RepID=A0ACD6A930_AVESA
MYTSLYVSSIYTFPSSPKTTPRTSPHANTHTIASLPRTHARESKCCSTLASDKLAAMASAARRSGALLVLMLAAAVVGLAGADFAADRAECADQLMGLATCLTYVQATATARAPTPDCCSGFRQVLGASKKCLCVLVKDRDEPALGLKINVTRAMNLPSVCAIPATFSDCPKILGMAPDSKEAEIFKQYGIEHEGKNATVATTTPAAATAASGTAGGKSADAKSGAGRQRQTRTTVFAGVVSALLASALVLA